MTTIATDGRTMAGDTLITAGKERLAFSNKIHRGLDGSIFGACGPSTDAARFRRWLCEPGQDRPELTDDFSALVLRPDGNAVYYCSKLEPIEMMLPQAIGSGADYAIGAMLAGATPTEAVRIACERDTCSGGEVTFLSPLPEAPTPSPISTIDSNSNQGPSGSNVARSD